jgi:hypothetical protein
MSFTRASYDVGAYSEEAAEIQGNSKYQLDPVQSIRPSMDYQFNDSTVLDTVTPYRHVSHWVDTESELQNLSRPLSKDPSQNFPYRQAPAEHEFTAVENTELSAKYTRLDYPAPNREQMVQTNRFYPVPLNPQALQRIHSNAYVGRNTTLDERDYHKLRIPVMVDQFAAMPKALDAGPYSVIDKWNSQTLVPNPQKTIPPPATAPAPLK